MKKLLLITSLLLLCSCATKYVTVPEYHTEYRTNTVRDSIYFEKHDSVMMKVKGDTVTVEHWKIRYRDRFVEVTDTFIKTDSIRVPYPVEKQLTWWQRLKIDFSEWIIIFLIVIVIAILAKSKLQR